MKGFWNLGDSGHVFVVFPFWLHDCLIISKVDYFGACPQGFRWIYNEVGPFKPLKIFVNKT